MGKTINVSCDACPRTDVVHESDFVAVTGLPLGWGALAFRVTRAMKTAEVESYIANSSGMTDAHKDQLRLHGTMTVTRDRILCPACAAPYETGVDVDATKRAALTTPKTPATQPS